MTTYALTDDQAEAAARFVTMAAARGSQDGLLQDITEPEALRELYAYMTPFIEFFDHLERGEISDPEMLRRAAAQVAEDVEQNIDYEADGLARLRAGDREAVPLGCTVEEGERQYVAFLEEQRVELEQARSLLDRPEIAA
ncbi:MAG TPA: hypothetical protein VEX39_06605 [Thermoleophilaceae bacterium]|nr:hypothetical protein [Thermoleophilaceae bacterium]